MLMGGVNVILGDDDQTVNRDIKFKQTGQKLLRLYVCHQCKKTATCWYKSADQFSTEIPYITAIFHLNLFLFSMSWCFLQEQCGVATVTLLHWRANIRCTLYFLLCFIFWHLTVSLWCTKQSNIFVLCLLWSSYFMPAGLLSWFEAKTLKLTRAAVLFFLVWRWGSSNLIRCGVNRSLTVLCQSGGCNLMYMGVLLIKSSK